MGARKRWYSRLPGWMQVPGAVALRTAFSPLIVAGPQRSGRWADALGDAMPRLHPSRFRRAQQNLRDAYPGWSEAMVRETACASYRHFFRLLTEFAVVPRLITREGCLPRLAFTENKAALSALFRERPTILISGHIGNWELIGYAISMLGFEMAAVYRPFDFAPIDEWVRQGRGQMGLTLVSKFGAVKEMPRHIALGRPVGLVADQSGGDRGIFTPFFGRLTSTYKSIGLLAMQSRARLVCGFARRLREGEEPPMGTWEASGVGERMRAIDRSGERDLRYSVEVVDSFGPEEWEGQPDPLYYICARYRRAMEMMVRRSPEQYFWMHRIWRSRPAHERLNKPFPEALRRKLAALPWMDEAGLEAVVSRSEADRAALHPGTHAG
jgi:KDO2-lipid IV(A) lauroyltransferase